ncbi:MAG: pro-sigmaK processing inhibitor BofA family protein [Cellulosilyticaceae bacterium]
MESIHPVILMSLGICGILLIYVLFEQHVGKFIRRGIIGGISIVIIDLFIPSLVAVGLNIYTIGVACFLGIPGVLILYILKNI